MVKDQTKSSLYSIQFCREGQKKHFMNYEIILKSVQQLMMYCCLKFCGLYLALVAIEQTSLTELTLFENRAEHMSSFNRGSLKEHF